MGTCTKNGHYKSIAVAIASGETACNITAALEAIDASARDKVDDDGRSEWNMSDGGPAMSAGLDEHMKAIGSTEERGNCSVHLFLDTIPKHRALLASADSYNRFFQDISRLQLIPKPWFTLAWAAIKRK